MRATLRPWLLRRRWLSSQTKVKISNLSKLRDLFPVNQFDAFLIPMNDPHLSEYFSDCFARIQYLSGFTGSAGTIVVTSSEAFLWTDGRYHLQAEMELDLRDWKLMKDGSTV
jgi:Xaa-Pro aminopeptidase